MGNCETKFMVEYRKKKFKIMLICNKKLIKTSVVFRLEFFIIFFRNKTVLSA